MQPVAPPYYQQQSFIPGPMQQSLAEPSDDTDAEYAAQYRSAPPQDGGLDWDAPAESPAVTRQAVPAQSAAPGGRRRYSALKA